MRGGVKMEEQKTGRKRQVYSPVSSRGNPGKLWTMPTNASTWDRATQASVRIQPRLSIMEECSSHMC